MAAIYHPLVAATAAMAALAMAQLARGAGLKPPSAALAGLLPVGAVLLYRYALHGGIKEVLVVALVATAAALAREALDRELSLRLVIVLAICGAALLHVFMPAYPSRAAVRRYPPQSRAPRRRPGGGRPTRTRLPYAPSLRPGADIERRVLHRGGHLRRSERPSAPSPWHSCVNRPVDAPMPPRAFSSMSAAARDESRPVDVPVVARPEAYASG
jgi:hypothetical protein